MQVTCDVNLSLINLKNQLFINTRFILLVCVTKFHNTLINFPYFFSKIVIEGVRGQSYAGDIAVDDVWIDDSPCPPEGWNFLYIAYNLFYS